MKVHLNALICLSILIVAGFNTAIAKSGSGTSYTILQGTLMAPDSSSNSSSSDDITTANHERLVYLCDRNHQVKHAVKADQAGHFQFFLEADEFYYLVVDMDERFVNFLSIKTPPTLYSEVLEVSVNTDPDKVKFSQLYFSESTMAGFLSVKNAFIGSPSISDAGSLTGKDAYHTTAISTPAFSKDLRTALIDPNR